VTTSRLPAGLVMIREVYILVSKISGVSLQKSFPMRLFVFSWEKTNLSKSQIVCGGLEPPRYRRLYIIDHDYLNMLGLIQIPEFGICWLKDGNIFFMTILVMKGVSRVPKKILPTHGEIPITPVVLSPVRRGWMTNFTSCWYTNLGGLRFVWKVVLLTLIKSTLNNLFQTSWTSLVWVLSPGVQRYSWFGTVELPGRQEWSPWVSFPGYHITTTWNGSPSARVVDCCFTPVSNDRRCMGSVDEMIRFIIWLLVDWLHLGRWNLP
jgi:hypothetical protein